MNDSDKDLHDEQLSNLYQQSRIEEPPMALDSAILTQARKAVEKPEKKAFWNRIGWMMPLASVAVAMLTVSLFIQTKQEHPEVLESEIMHDVTPMGASVLEKEDDAEPLKDRKMRVAPAPKAAKRVIDKKGEAEQLIKDEKRAVQAEKTAKELIRKQKVVGPSVMQAPGVSAPSSATGVASQAPKAKRMLKQQSRPAAASTFMAAPVPAEADSIESGMLNEEMESRGVLRSRTIRSQSEAESKISSKAKIEIWLEQIRQLIRLGKTDEAIKSLEAFRKAYPGQQLPEDITSTLE